MFGHRTLLRKRLWEEVKELEEKALHQEARIRELEELVSKRTSEMAGYFKRLEASKERERELTDELEAYRQRFPVAGDGGGLCALVVNMWNEGKSREEIAACLHEKKDNGFPGISHAIICSSSDLI